MILGFSGAKIEKKTNTHISVWWGILWKCHSHSHWSVMGLCVQSTWSRVSFLYPYVMVHIEFLRNLHSPGPLFTKPDHILFCVMSRLWNIWWADSLVCEPMMTSYAVKCASWSHAMLYAMLTLRLLKKFSVLFTVLSAEILMARTALPYLECVHFSQDESWPSP